MLPRRKLGKYKTVYFRWWKPLAAVDEQGCIYFVKHPENNVETNDN
jgi:hypothetical protein